MRQTMFGPLEPFTLVLTWKDGRANSKLSVLVCFGLLLLRKSKYHIQITTEVYDKVDNTHISLRLLTVENA